MFVVLGYDEDWYTFEEFLGVFSSREKAEEFVNNDFWTYTHSGNWEEIIPNHEHYEIKEVTLDTPFKDHFYFPHEED